MSRAKKADSEDQTTPGARDVSKEIWGIVFLALAVLVLVSLVSHFSQGAGNILGPYVGTALARGLVTIFGPICCFSFPLLVGFVGVSRLLKPTVNKWNLLFGILFTVELCVFLAISGEPIRTFTPNLIGSIVAYFLQKLFGLNPFGPYFITSIGVLISCVIGFQIDVGKYFALFVNELRELCRAMIRKPIPAPVAPWSTPLPPPATETPARRSRKTAEQEKPSADVKAAAGPGQPPPPLDEAEALLQKQMAEFRAKKSKPITITTDPAAPATEGPEDNDVVGEAENAALARAAMELAKEDSATPVGDSESPETGADSGVDAAEQPIVGGDATAGAPDGYYKVPQEETKRKIPVNARPYEVPSPEVMPEPPPVSSNINREEIEKNSQTLEKTLLNFGLEGKVVNVSPGPIITRYEIELAPGIKVSRVVNLQDDISLAVGGQKIRIQAPIPGKAAIGIELPNENRQTVYFKSILTSDVFTKSKAKLPVVIGRSISGAPYIADITKMPHVLIAGQTGSGKSVCINSFICSMLMTKTPDELRLIMIDPKKVELSYYQGVPHLMAPVVTETKEAVRALQWGQDEMERRYRMFAKVGARNIESFNARVASGGIKPGSISDEDNKSLPFLVIIVDELADLMITAPKDVEASIQRIAQMARAVGIHLIVATQRPSVDIITGRIKANLTSRIAFRTIQATDSRTILEHPGSEKLLGMGDMLFLRSGAPDIERFHGALINEDEVEKIVDVIKKQTYETERLDGFVADDDGDETLGDDDDSDAGGRDPLFRDAAEIIVGIGQGSTSLLQRRMKLGFARAGRVMDQLERAGIVGPSEGSKAREVLVKPNDLDAVLDRLK